MDLKEARNKYKHIVAWCTIIHGDSTYFIDEYLKEAIKYDAPDNAVYRDKSGVWKTYDDVTNPTTRKYMERVLYPDRVREVVTTMTPLMPGVTRSFRKYIVCQETNEKWKTVKEAAKAVGCTPDYLNDCIRLGNKCKGKTFERVME